MLFWASFTLGIGGSLHCLAMCGPLAMAIPGSRSSGGEQLVASLTYHAGRISTYASIGLLVGGLGFGFHLAAWQGQIALITGVVILVAAIWRFDFRFGSNGPSWLLRWQNWVTSQFGRLAKRRDLSSVFGMGILNGFIPCGLVYLALIATVNAQSPWLGSWYMVGFGLGTLPLLLVSSLAGHKLLNRLGPKRRLIQQGLLIIVGLLFIWRGLAFHMPADFVWWQDGNFAPFCH